MYFFLFDWQTGNYNFENFAELLKKRHLPLTNP